MKGKPFKETKAYQIATKFLPGLVKSVADVIPGGKLVTGIIEEITGAGHPITPEELQELRSYEKEMYALEVQDRQSARTRETDYLKAAGHVDWMMYFVGLSVMASFLFLQYVLINVSIPAENRDIFIHMVGMIDTAVGLVIGYYFGSSKGSTHKNSWVGNKQ